MKYQVKTFDKHQNKWYYTDGRTWSEDSSKRIGFFKFWLLYYKYWYGNKDIKYKMKR